MAFFLGFLSVVCVLRNQSEQQCQILSALTGAIAPLVDDYEIIVVDNASADQSLDRLKALTSDSGLPNLQVFALLKEVDADTASWVGLEHALGDLVVVFDPLSDDISFLPTMLERAQSGADVVFAANEMEPRQGIAYRIPFLLFQGLYKWFSGIHLAKEAPRYRVLSKKVVNAILQHPQPAITYRHLPASGGFAKANLTYTSAPKTALAKRPSDSIDRDMRLLFSTTRAPMRLVTALCLFGALVNILYSVYVVAIALLKADVAPGWVSLSLQQSGMFFLLSLVLLVLGEYILNMATLSNDGPLYHVAQELTSARTTRRERLNIEEPHAVESQQHPIVARAASR